MKLETYLSEVFGEEIVVKNWIGVDHLPLFLQNEYEFSTGDLHGHTCLFMQVRSKQLLPDKIMKNFAKLSETVLGEFVLIFDELRPYQRRMLVKNRIAFVIPDKQAYLPFVYLDFRENLSYSKPTIAKFTPATQCVFLAIFYQLNDELSASELSSRLNLAAVSVYRAINSLVTLQLITVEGKATRKKFTRLKKELYWLKGKEYLINPIIRILYLSSLPRDVRFFESNESALAQQSMLVSPPIKTYAIGKKYVAKLDKNLLLEEDKAISDVYVTSYKVEVWAYDPELFARNNIVDVCSIYAELKGLDDPRIDIEIETLIKGEL